MRANLASIELAGARGGLGRQGKRFGKAIGSRLPLLILGAVFIEDPTGVAGPLSQTGKKVAWRKGFGMQRQNRYADSAVFVSNKHPLMVSKNYSKIFSCNVITT